MDVERICYYTAELVKNTGLFIARERENFSMESVQSKGEHDFVTYVDKSSEERLVEGLKNILPGAGFITEEGTNTQKGKLFNWVIDPLDGTTNFIHGAPPYAISVALMEGSQVILGIVYEITSSEMFYSYQGAPAFLNGKNIQVSSVKKVTDSLIATGFPYTKFERIDAFLQSLEYFFIHSHGVRRLGSAATDLAYVACGRYDTFYEYNLNSWDVAAGAFIVQQAGGKVSDFKAGENYIFGNEIIAANAILFSEFRQLVGDFMNAKR
jgi:myo-inositol-1(or 4)-monophosphatase